MSSQAPSREQDETPGVSVGVRGYYWERVRRGALPVVLGALGLAGLGVGQLLPVRHEAESDLRVRSLAALGSAGLAGVDVDFTGQDGVLRGQVASAVDVERALQIVRGLEGVRVARSELTYPGSNGGTEAPAASESFQPSASPSWSVTPSAVATPTPSAVATPTPSAVATPTPSAVAPTPTPSVTPSAAPKPATPAAPSAATVQKQLSSLPSVGFVFGSTELSPAGRATVARMAAALKANPNLKIKVNGYTDDIGGWDVNLAISKGRAEAVRQALIANGIPASRITATGWSESRPKVPNTSAANRAINRRVEVVVG